MVSVTYTMSFDQYDALKQAAAMLAALEQGDVIGPRVAETIRDAAEKALAVNAMPVSALPTTNRNAA